jgi:hypothetical protein
MRKTVLLMSLVGIIAGCSDPKAANEANFKTAMQNYLNTAYPKCYVLQKFPASIQAGFDLFDLKPKFVALSKAGLLAETEQTEVQNTGFGGKRTITKTVFDLTPEGKKYYKEDAGQSMSGNRIGGFCGGKATVTAVTQFTEPSDLMGQKISRVNYEYKVSDFPDWAKSPEVQAQVKGLKADVESDSVPLKALDVALLTNNGWVHERLFQK